MHPRLFGMPRVFFYPSGLLVMCREVRAVYLCSWNLVFNVIHDKIDTHACIDFVLISMYISPQPLLFAQHHNEILKG